jgi:biopolymer transport protein ExbD
MLGGCLKSWQTYGCEWSIGYLWRWTNWISRLDVFVLALMLAYTLAVFIRVSYRYRVARQARVIGSASRRKLAVELNIEVGNLKSIASTAPYLGLVGTCFGIMSAFRGIAMQKDAALAMIASEIVAALTTTAAGIIVAVPATCSYNYLRTRLDLLENKVPARRLPLAKRFSELPAFAQIAAPALAVSIAAFMLFPSPNSPKGLHVRLLKVGSSEPEDHLRVEPLLIRLLDTSAGPPSIFVNSRRTMQNELKNAVQASLKPGWIVNIAADKNVSWADVANAIDVAEGLDGDVVLLTARPVRYSGHNW